jgi:hypothetical protein
MSEPDRTKLPIRRAPFQGVANRTLHGSNPDWDLIGHVDPPPGVPNVLLVLIDDAGFGNPSTFGGPSIRRITRGWPKVGCGTTASMSRRCVRPRGRRY